MRHKTVCLGFMARNIESIADYTLLRISRICEMFKHHYVFCLENGSTDRTRAVIESYFSKQDFNFFLLEESEQTREIDRLSFQTDRSFNRCKRMAMARNILRDEMLKSTQDTDYFIMCDADLLGGFSYEGIANSFSYEWDICASNSIIYINRQRCYYDSWAWRDLDHFNPHTDQEINPRRYERGQTPVDVASAFGGMAIYNTKFFPQTKYRYKATDCDHPTIHIPMYKDGAKIIMNPSMIALYSKTRYVV